MSIAGMVCSIVSFFTLPVILGIVGLILSIQGQKKTPEGVQNTYAKAGKILGIINIVIGALAICGIVILIIVAASNGDLSSATNSYTF